MLNLYHYINDLKNVNEKRVWSMLAEYVDDNNINDICTCSICLMDVAAITLNSIPAHYMCEENMVAAQEKISDTEIFEQLKKAMIVVEKTPHH
ncbi:MAG: late competence development ComFB family protein [Deferribacteraceae bacterium]|jgi:competence protein ComFB|nr:late competence development ComFB family protein [Deferribacteraceae bacterium]